VVRFLNDVSKDHDVVLLNDIAYMDFSYRGKGARNYLSVFDGISDKVAVVIAFSLSKSMTCYGMRCGAAILLAKREETVQELRTVFEKEARAVWSNVNNGAMAMFADVMENHLDAYEAERDQYTELLKKRSDLFLKEANEAGLAHYPYKEGFFVTLAMDNDVRDKFHEALMAEDIYTVKVNKGIRVAVCSLPLRQVPGLAKRMKDILNIVEKG
jgi:aspartate aminotransferase/aromatic-amino-acid transaminase